MHYQPILILYNFHLLLYQENIRIFLDADELTGHRKQYFVMFLKNRQQLTIDHFLETIF